MIIDDELADFLESGASQYLGTADVARVPSIGRGWGMQVERGSGRARLLVGPYPAVLANLRPGGRVALTLSDPTYRSIQLKGTVLAVVDELDPSDRTVRDRYRAEFAVTVAAIGNDPSLVDMPSEHFAVTIEFDALFDQTPGPNAGQRLRAFPA